MASAETLDDDRTTVAAPDVESEDGTARTTARPRRRDLLSQVSGQPLLRPAVVAESVRMRSGHPIDPDARVHLASALDWLARSQDVTGSGGLARGYSLTWNRYFKASGWQPAYPETTGYTIPTLYLAGDLLGRPDLHTRAERAAQWEVEIQMASGAVRGGVVTSDPSTPAVFNTGQVIFGWLAAWERTGDETFARSVQRAAAFLVDHLDDDGIWRRGNSQFTRRDSTLYNARTAWALAEAGERLAEPAFSDAARRALLAVVERQHPNGWFPGCCLTDPERPLLHTIAYTVRGLLEGGRVLHDERFVHAAARAASMLARTVSARGTMPGRYHDDWSGAVRWCCLTGLAQMSNCWLRLGVVTGDAAWPGPVDRVLDFLKTTQNRSSDDAGLNGGIKGSWPLSGGYAPYELLNWATKFFADALMRRELEADDPRGLRARNVLA